MHLIQPDLHAPRISAPLHLTGAGRHRLPFALNLAAMGEAAAFTATDYKALVRVSVRRQRLRQHRGHVRRRQLQQVRSHSRWRRPGRRRHCYSQGGPG